MKTIVCLILLLAPPLLAGEAADRLAIERVVGMLNEGASGLFTADAAADRRLIQWPQEPLSEVSSPRLVVQSVRFLTPDVALVDASNTQFGSLILVRRQPLLLVMKREAAGWKIAAVRVLTSLSGAP